MSLLGNNYVPYTIEGIAHVRKRVLRANRKYKGLVNQKTITQGHRSVVVNQLVIPHHLFMKYEMCKKLGLIKLV